MLYKLEKPNLLKATKEKVLKRFFTIDDAEIVKDVLKTTSPKYLYWDTVKYRERPKNFTAEEFWIYIKFIRKAQMLKSVIKDEKGNYFSWIKLPQLEKFFHEVDFHTGGSLFDFTKNIEDSNKYKFISRGIMEEAIASSQLEGAVTSRRMAKQFLREGRKPKNKSEQMILNNHIAMQIVENKYKDEKLTTELLFELHKVVTKDTLEKKVYQGALRHDNDDIMVVGDDGTIYHIPPKHSFVKKEIERLVDFANDDLETEFIHPIVKAILIHFWIGYLHPFVDGNGRMARLLFYWYLLKKNYWAFAYLPISKIIKKSPGQYRDAYVYSEQDDLDLTYFIDYNIRKIKLAMEDFKEYINKQSKLNKQMNKLSRSKHNLNERQIQLLQYLYKNRDENTTIKIHMKINQIAKQTAIKDLRGLIEKKFTYKIKRGRNVYYYATKETTNLFK